MKVFEKRADITAFILQQKAAGQSIGFVPTMGALHAGHLELVSRSVKENDLTVVSIFVNPTQFNNPNDFKSYPRIQEKDLGLLETVHCDIAFIPSVEEMYPKPDQSSFDYGNLDKVMEGEHRPGHFNGVSQIVKKLFETVPANRAYFGMKDFQQLAIIRAMVAQQKISIEIVAHPTVREGDGLALSSRNLLLSKEQRANASHIYATLTKAKQLKDSCSVEDLKKWVVEEINKNPYLKTEYYDIVDDTTLQSIKDWNDSKNIIGCIAVFAGNVRLIDNMYF